MPDDTERLVQILLGEAAGEGIEGLTLVRDTLYNRAKAKGKTLLQVALEPKQFTAASRKDLPEFTLQQPMLLRNLAEQLIRETEDKAFQPTHATRHYVTKDLWDSRGTLKKDHWLNNMKVVQQVGNHVALTDAREQ